MSPTTISSRLAAIDGANRKERAANQVDYWYQLRMYVSSPPDTVLHIRSGWVQLGPNYITQQAVYFPPLDLDFSSTAQFFNGYSGALYSEYTGNFANVNWYIPVLVMYDYNYFVALRDSVADIPPCKVVGGEPEYETAVEAEGALDGFFDGIAVRYRGDMPLCGVILRNDGMTGIDGRVRPIDPINRGRSYFWRDLRPRHTSLYYDGYY